jgi:hypothetical protein
VAPHDADTGAGSTPSTERKERERESLEHLEKLAENAGDVAPIVIARPKCLLAFEHDFFILVVKVFRHGANRKSHLTRH